VDPCEARWPSKERTHPSGVERSGDVNSTLIPGAASGDDYTTSFKETEVYDDFVVQALLNQIDGQWSDHGLSGRDRHRRSCAGVPSIFGMNFQAVSVAQKNARTPNEHARAVAEQPAAWMAWTYEATLAGLSSQA
jgi:hypothetical protein